LTKLSNDLRETHNAIVPDLVSDDSFWRNYFYEIELKFSELGEHSKIGQKVSAQEQADRRAIVDAMYETPYINQESSEEEVPFEEVRNVAPPSEPQAVEMTAVASP
jgi:hypothetical protein